MSARRIAVGGVISDYSVGRGVAIEGWIVAGRENHVAYERFEYTDGRSTLYHAPGPCHAVGAKVDETPDGTLAPCKRCAQSSRWAYEQLHAVYGGALDALVADVTRTHFKRLPSSKEMSLAGLSELHRAVITMRRQGLTLEQIGSTMGVTRERVRQIQEKAVGLCDDERRTWLSQQRGCLTEDLAASAWLNAVGDIFKDIVPVTDQRQDG